MRGRRRYSIRYLFLTVWVIFTVSLSCWWVYFGIQQIHLLMSVGYGHENDLVRYQRMLIFEGGTLLLSLFAGGATLAYYMYREVKQGDQLKSFFLAFTHDTKTALAAVQLQAELLQERVQSDSDKAVADRLLADVERLSLQFENSLYVANLDKKQLHLERVELRDSIESLRGRFPKLRIEDSGACWVSADIRALESILINLCQNSLIHGEATRVLIESTPAKPGTVRVQITDDGKGFPGDKKRLAERFFRHYSGSGSGLGLYIARVLARAMKGSIDFPDSPTGFQAVLFLPGGESA